MSTSEWFPIEEPKCDVCGHRAALRHPAGGLRCRRCHRPEKSAPSRCNCGAFIAEGMEGFALGECNDCYGRGYGK